MVKSKEQSASATLDLSQTSWDSLSNPVKDFLKKQGITEANFGGKPSSSERSAPTKPAKKRFSLGERHHHPVAERETETTDEGEPAVDPGATARELSYHQATMEEGDPSVATETEDEDESAEAAERRRYETFVRRYVGDSENPGVGRSFTTEEAELIYQKYQELNPNITDTLNISPQEAHTELCHELENMISHETDPDRKDFLKKTLTYFSGGEGHSSAMDESHLRELFSALQENLETFVEDETDPTKKNRLESMIELTSDLGLSQSDVLGDVEDEIQAEYDRETNLERKQQLAELLIGLQDRVAISSAERFAGSQADRVAPGYQTEFIHWMKRVAERGGARGTKEQREKGQIGGWRVAYETYAVLHQLAGGYLDKNDVDTAGELGAEGIDRGESEALPIGDAPDFEAIYAKMKEHKLAYIDWSKVEAFSPYGRKLHQYIETQKTLRAIESADDSCRKVYDSKRRERDAWRAVVTGEKQPTKKQQQYYEGFVRAEMGKAFSEELQLAQQALTDARNLATYDHLREEGRAMKRIADANGEGLSAEDQAYYDQVRDESARSTMITKIYNQRIRDLENQIRIAENPGTGWVDMGEDADHPEQFIEKKRLEIAAAERRVKELRSGAELTPEETVVYDAAKAEYGMKDFIRRRQYRTDEIKAQLSKPPLVGLHRRIDSIKAKLPEGQTLDDLVARRESQHKYLLDLRERYRTGAGRTEREKQEIQAYRDRVASPLAYYRHLQEIVKKNAEAHELNRTAHQRIINISQRDQGHFTDATFGEYFERASDDIYDAEIDELQGKEPHPDYRHPDPYTPAEIAEWRDSQETALVDVVEKRTKRTENYLYQRYGGDLAILGVDTEDHPGKLETLRAILSDLSSHIEGVRSRIEHLPKTAAVDVDTENLVGLITEESDALWAVRYLRSMIKRVEQDEAERADASRIQVSGTHDKPLAEAA